MCTHCTVQYILYSRVVQTICPKNQIIWELKIAQYKMYTKILAQGTKFGSGTTGLDHPAVQTVLRLFTVHRTVCANTYNRTVGRGVACRGARGDTSRAPTPRP